MAHLIRKVDAGAQRFGDARLSSPRERRRRVDRIRHQAAIKNTAAVREVELWRSLEIKTHADGTIEAYQPSLNRHIGIFGF
jgi:hypothetical protein